jgi:hypothetical protein
MIQKLTREEKYWLRNGLIEYPCCKYCNQPLTSKNFIKNGPAGYRPYCGIKCAKKDQDYSKIIPKRTTTNQERYGSSSPWHFSAFRQYMKERYGVEYVESESDD